MKNILIIGATSVIAQHCARLWAQRGDNLFLVARNEEQLEAIASDLKIRGANAVFPYTLDVNNLDQHLLMLDALDSKNSLIDIVLIAHGTLSDQSACELDVALMLNEIKTNALSTIALLTHIANRFEAKRSGIIAIISSVAGDRGRASNYVYGSAKAMVTAFASGLRQRLYKSNVSVVTIKPGLIDTPMTKDFEKGLLWVKPSRIAGEIVAAIDGKKDEIYAPSYWRLILAIVKIMPNALFKRLSGVL